MIWSVKDFSILWMNFRIIWRAIFNVNNFLDSEFFSLTFVWLICFFFETETYILKNGPLLWYACIYVFCNWMKSIRKLFSLKNTINGQACAIPSIYLIFFLFVCFIYCLSTYLILSVFLTCFWVFIWAFIKVLFFWYSLVLDEMVGCMCALLVAYAQPVTGCSSNVYVQLF